MLFNEFCKLNKEMHQFEFVFFHFCVLKKALQNILHKNIFIFQSKYSYLNISFQKSNIMIAVG